ncbi:TRASH domain-containing protein [Metallosphaera hakonensis]|uniref:TRASH domain-containing protein n=1 Tax=Metallosphaera hakonensis TaxID=79601 RepID=UPI00197B09EC|nr:TRASH domain-containing protein [Metallosphaera hakonensis]
MTNVKELSEIEYKVLQYLRSNSRLSSSRLAKELGLSRATVAKVINSLREKGVKFTVDYYEDGKITVFAISDTCASEGECYKLIDGRFMVTLSGNMEEVQNLLSKIKSENYFIAVNKVGSASVKQRGLKCDYCGGEITGEPLLIKRGKRTYYACCRTCRTHLEKRLGEKG